MVKPWLTQADCSVDATEDTRALFREFPIDDRRRVDDDHGFELGSMWVQPFAVEHSLNCPAVAYRIQAGRAVILYCPDVVYIHDRDQAMRGVKLYIGDGASVDRDLVRKQGDRLIGRVSCAEVRADLITKYDVGSGAPGDYGEGAPVMMSRANQGLFSGTRLPGALF